MYDGVNLGMIECLQLGDCFDLISALPDGSIDLLITDPPYGVLKHKIETDVNIEQFMREAYRVLKPNAFLVYFGMQPTLTYWNLAAFEQGFNYKAEIIWYKRNVTNMLNDITRLYENVMVVVKGKRRFEKVYRPYTDVKSSLAEFTEATTVLGMVDKAASVLKNELRMGELKLALKGDKTAYICKHVNNEYIAFNRDRKTCNRHIDGCIALVRGLKPQNVVSFKPYNLQKYDTNKEGGGEHNVKHPTVKPIQLMEYLIELCSVNGDLILDPFMGSGTTGLACQNLTAEGKPRGFIGFELQPEYYAISCDRMRANAAKHAAKHAAKQPIEPVVEPAKQPVVTSQAKPKAKPTDQQSLF